METTIYVPELLADLEIVRLALLDMGDHDAAAKCLMTYEVLRDAWNDDSLAWAP